MRYIITLLLTATPAFSEVPSVVTDIPPVHALVAQVMGDLGQPELLLAKGADEHDFQLRPSQAGAVAGADLVVWIGPELTPWLDSALETRPDGAAELALLRAEGTRLQDYAAGHSEAEEAGHDEAEDGHDPAEEEEAGEEHGSTDPHAWLDPGNAQVWLGSITDALVELDPENAARYRANAEAARANLAALDAEVAAILAPARDKPIVNYHDAFGYFIGHYGLTVVGSIALGDASAPGAARLAALRDEIEAGGVTCLFPEVQHDPALVTQMVEGTGARIGGALDPVGSSLEPGPGAYAALLTGLAQAIADCAAG
jgi:zinc transport system substrate-binding protein